MIFYYDTKINRKEKNACSKEGYFLLQMLTIPPSEGKLRLSQMLIIMAVQRGEAKRLLN